MEGAGCDDILHSFTASVQAVHAHDTHLRLYRCSYAGWPECFSTAFSKQRGKYPWKWATVIGNASRKNPSSIGIGCSRGSSASTGQWDGASTSIRGGDKIHLGASQQEGCLLWKTAEGHSFVLVVEEAESGGSYRCCEGVNRTQTLQHSQNPRYLPISCFLETSIVPDPFWRLFATMLAWETKDDSCFPMFRHRGRRMHWMSTRGCWNAGDQRGMQSPRMARKRRPEHSASWCTWHWR